MVSAVTTTKNSFEDKLVWSNKSLMSTLGDERRGVNDVPMCLKINTNCYKEITWIKYTSIIYVTLVNVEHFKRH